MSSKSHEPVHPDPSGDDRSPSRRRRTLTVVIRILVSAGLIAWLLRRVELEAIADALAGARWPLVLLSTLLFVSLRPVVATARWHIILRGDGMIVPAGQVLRWTVMSAFFALFLPGSLGGDGARILWVERHLQRQGRGAATVVMERVVGFVSLLGLVAVAILLAHQVISDRRLYVALGVGALAGLLVIAGLFHPRLYRIAVALLVRLHLPRVAKLVEGGFAALGALGRQRRVLLWAVVLSLAFQATHIVCVYTIGRSLGLSTPLGFYFMAMPVVSMLSVLPVSINGIGVREGAFVLIFSMVGIAEAHALTVSLLSTLQVFALGLLGGLAYAMDPWLRRERRRPGSMAS